MLAALIWYIIVFLSIFNVLELKDIVLKKKRLENFWDIFWFGKYVIIQVIIYLIAFIVNDSLIFFYFTEARYIDICVLIVILAIIIAVILYGYLGEYEYPWGKVILAFIIIIMLLVSPIIVAGVNPKVVRSRIIDQLNNPNNVIYDYPNDTVVEFDELYLIRKTTWIFTKELFARALANESSRVDISTVEDVDPIYIPSENTWGWFLIPNPRELLWLSQRPVESFVLYLDNSNMTIKRIPIEIYWFKRNSPWRIDRIVYKHFQDYAILQIRNTFYRGKPYYVAYLGRVDCYGIQHVEKVLIVDPTVPEEKYEVFDIQDAPEWIMKIPDHVLENQLAWWAQWRFGWWHAWFVKREIYELADIARFIVLNNTPYWQVLLKYSASNVLAGYVLVNTLTLEAKFYYRGHLSYPCPATVKELCVEYLKSGEEGFRILNVTEVYLYPIRLPSGRTVEVYILPLYTGFVFYGFMIVDPIDYSKYVICKDLKQGLLKLYGELPEGEQVESYNITVISGVIEEDKAYITVEFENGTIRTYIIEKEVLITQGNIQSEYEWVELRLCVNSPYEYRNATIGFSGKEIVDFNWPYSDLVPD